MRCSTKLILREGQACAGLKTEGRGPTRIQKSVPGATGKQAAGPAGPEKAACGREAGEASGWGGRSVHAAAHLSKGGRGALKGQGPAGHSSGNTHLWMKQHIQH